MKKCLGCGGLVPLASDACPNCAVTAKKSRVPRGALLLAAAGFATITASGCSPMALYGIPCTADQVDGGHNGCGGCDTRLTDGGDPRKDPNDTCFVDGGTP